MTYIWRTLVLMLLAGILGMSVRGSDTLLRVDKTTVTNLDYTEQVLDALETQDYKLNDLWALANDRVAPLCDAPATTAEEEYHRGVYDTCMQQIKTPAICRQLLQGVITGDWFSGPSVEWTWPLPAPGTAPNLNPKGDIG